MTHQNENHPMNGYDCLVCGATAFTETDIGSFACNDCGQDYWPATA